MNLLIQKRYENSLYNNFELKPFELMISMWSGSVNNIPTGWALCNGQNGTPDLRDRFIVSYGNTFNTIGKKW